RRVGNAHAAQLRHRAAAVQRHNGFSGKVTLPGGNGRRPLNLASEYVANALGEEKRRALRVDLRTSLEDAVDDPEKIADMDRLILAHACRMGESGEDVILNCKSGKTRTPIVAIVHLLLREVDLSVARAVDTVAKAFKAQRPKVGIDYDRKLTGVRLLDAEGRLATAEELAGSRRLNAARP
ncbi:MAG TPA: hypothetical protein VNT55_04290, partial [Baekduia sp.]|nr:hypothetical protein [Baekduia sp.]